MSSRFCVPQLLKLVYFSFYWKKRKRYVGFFVILRVWLALFRCRFVPSSRQILATPLVLSTEDGCLIACTIVIQRRHCPSQNDDLTADNNCDRAGVHSLIHTTTIARVLLTTPVPRIKVGRAIDAAEIRRILETGPRPRTRKREKSSLFWLWFLWLVKFLENH